MTALLFTSTIRRIEADGLARTGPGELMARAASAVADAVEELLREGPVGRPVFAFCGPGNNGGDALLATLLLHERGFDARAFELAGCAAGAAPPDDTARVRARAAALGLSPTRLQSGDALHALFAPWTNGPATGAPRPVPLVVDGLFGIGLARPLDGLAAELCRLLAGLESPVVAIDVPSGVDTDTGALVGPVAMPATLTVTMIGVRSSWQRSNALTTCERSASRPTKGEPPANSFLPSTFVPTTDVPSCSRDVRPNRPENVGPRCGVASRVWQLRQPARATSSSPCFASDVSAIGPSGSASHASNAACDSTTTSASICECAAPQYSAQ